MRKLYVVAGIVAVVMIASSVICRKITSWERLVIIPEQKIQTALNEAFPVHNENRFIKATWSDPLIDLDSYSNRVAFSLNAEIEFLRENYSGEAKVSGEIEYKKSTGSFYLSKSKIESLKIEGVSEEKLDKITKIVSKVIYFRLDAFPVYTLKRSDKKQLLAKALIKSVEIHGNNVEVLLGP